MVCFLIPSLSYFLTLPSSACDGERIRSRLCFTGRGRERSSQSACCFRDSSCYSNRIRHIRSHRSLCFHLLEINSIQCCRPQSLFNITFCYFPITFRPPPNDPYGITTEDLRLALR